MAQDDVTVEITQSTPALSGPGFGTPMLLGYSATWPERVRIYSDIDGMVSDGLALDSPEVLWASALTSQDNHPEQFMIGRGTRLPTLAYQVGVVTVINTHAYVVSVVGQGFAATDCTYTSDGSATNDEIAAGLVVQLNLVSGKNYTATATGSAGSQVVAITANAAGQWFSAKVGAVADLSNQMTHADPGVASDLEDINTVNSDWYALGTVFNSKPCILAGEGWVTTHDKLYLWADVDTRAITATATGNQDAGDTSKPLAYARCSGEYYDDPSKMLVGAHYGSTLGFDPGSINFKFRTLQGVPPLKLTDTHRTNLKARLMNSYETRFGRGCTFEGYTFDGNFVDTIRNKDWLTQQMILQVAQPLFDNPNLPLTDGTIAIFNGKMKTVLALAVTNNVLLAGTTSTKVPLAKDISAADRQAKLLAGLQFFGTNASGVNKLKIKGSITNG